MLIKVSNAVLSALIASSTAFRSLALLVSKEVKESNAPSAVSKEPAAASIEFFIVSKLERSMLPTSVPN